jgi:[ribosomal protein S5]-alanine N-acetyltransferase
MGIKLRTWKQEDLADLVHHANNPKIAERLTDAFPSPYTFEKGQEFLDRMMKQSPCEVMAIDLNGKVIGNIGIHPQSDVNRLNAELGYFIGEDYWGKGYATEAIQLMVEYGFKNFPIERIFARPFGSNIASQRVLEKAGFVLEARINGILIKNGKIEDELIFGLRKEKI